MNWDHFGGADGDHLNDPDPFDHAEPARPNPVQASRDQPTRPRTHRSFRDRVADPAGWPAAAAAATAFIAAALAAATWASDGTAIIDTYLWGMRGTATLPTIVGTIDATIPLLGIAVAGMIAAHLTSRVLRSLNHGPAIVHGTRVALIVFVATLVASQAAGALGGTGDWKPASLLLVPLAAPAIAATTGASRADRAPGLVAWFGAGAAPWSAATAAAGAAARVAFVGVALLAVTGSNQPLPTVAGAAWPAAGIYALADGVYTPFRIVTGSTELGVNPLYVNDTLGRLVGIAVAVTLTVGLGAALQSLRATGTHLAGAFIVGSAAGCMVIASEFSAGTSLFAGTIRVGPSPGMTALLVFAIALVAAPAGRWLHVNARPVCRALGVDHQLPG